MSEYVLAVDLGGTQIRAARCDAAGHILERTALPARAAEGPAAVFARIGTSIRAVAGDWARVRAIGVSAPGPLDPWRGIILESPNLPGMIDFALKARLEQEFHLPAYIGNDANLAALGEHRFGAGRGVAHMIYLTISTGIGGGIITNNALFLGWRGFAGEVGHQTIDVNGPLCNCGNIGCLEALAAGWAIARDARDALRAGRASAIRAIAHDDLDQITGKVVVQAARAGDTLAREILERAGRYIGFGLVNLLHNFDTALFVLGGGIAIHAWEFLYPPMEATLRKHAFPSMSRSVRIVPAELGDDAGLLGAVVLVNESMSQ